VYQATIRQYLRPGTRLLDVGCGRGGVVEQLLEYECRMVGVDPDICSLAEHRLPAALLPCAAGFSGQLPFHSGSFDLVISSWVLEHLPRPAAAFAEAARVLRPDGHLVTLAPNRWHPVTLLNRLLAWAEPIQTRLVPRLYGRAEEDAFPVYYRANSARRLRQLGVAAGLTPVAIQTVSDPTYLAFNELLFSLSRGLEQLLPAAAWIHLVADFAHA
jgi:ubiquinone/menaquinone biosynthesis C-methylase UbiE